MRAIIHRLARLEVGRDIDLVNLLVPLPFQRCSGWAHEVYRFYPVRWVDFGVYLTGRTHKTWYLLALARVRMMGTVNKRESFCKHRHE